MTEIALSVVNSIWAQIVYYFTLQFIDIDPIFKYAMWGIIIIFVTWGVTHFLGDYIPILKPIAFVIILLVTFGLYAYRKGENDTKARIKRRTPVLPPPEPKPRDDGGGFFRSWH